MVCAGEVPVFSCVFWPWHISRVSVSPLALQSRGIRMSKLKSESHCHMHMLALIKDSKILL